MRALMIPVLAAGVLSASLAFAAQSSTGSIKAVNMSAHTLTLNNGKTYHLASGVKADGLKAGEKVRITWEMKNNKHEASKVSVVN